MFTELICAWCDKIFNKQKSEYNRQVRNGRNRDHFFCGLSCSALYGNSLRPPGRSKSTLCRKAHEAYKGKWICIDCGQKATDVHHADRDRYNNTSENLVALCRGCHISLHNKAGETGRSSRIGM